MVDLPLARNALWLYVSVLGQNGKELIYTRLQFYSTDVEMRVITLPPCSATDGGHGDQLLFWPYMKLMATCFLVLPHFNGASYVYECLLRPCLSVDPRGAIKYFIKPKEGKSNIAEVFLAVAERYVEENGSEALEKLLDRKSKLTKPDIGMEEIKAMANTEEKETAAAIRSKYKEHNVGKVDAGAVEQPEKRPIAATTLSKVEEPSVGKENANTGQLKDENPAVATEQYNDENTVSFVTLNKVSGFLQRMDLARKFAFGKMLIIGSEPPFKVKGLWLFHGQQIPQFIIDECYDMELYDWKKVDISDEDQKERVNQMIEDQDPFEGEALLDAKCFK
ncbi:hypothetical protein C3L33_21100, partial [Rhododendron williamsianum]